VTACRVSFQPSRLWACPRARRTVRGRKRSSTPRETPHYQRHRVSEYWIVDDASQTIERWTPADERPDLLAERLVWHPDGALEPFVLDLVQFFADVVAED
jgi:hypothetical protein